MLHDAIHHAFPKANLEAPVQLDKVSGDLSVFFGFFDSVSKAFDEFDADGDGSISVDELCAALRALGQESSEAEVAALVAAYDENDNGVIDFDEFCMLVTDKVRPAGVDSRLVAMVGEAARDVVSGRRRAAAEDAVRVR